MSKEEQLVFEVPMLKENQRKVEAEKRKAFKQGRKLKILFTFLA